MGVTEGWEVLDMFCRLLDWLQEIVIILNDVPSESRDLNIFGSNPSQRKELGTN